MCVGGLSKHCTSAVTEPGSEGPCAGSRRSAVAFHPFSVAKGLSDLIRLKFLSLLVFFDDKNLIK